MAGGMGLRAAGADLGAARTGSDCAQVECDPQRHGPHSRPSCAARDDGPCILHVLIAWISRCPGAPVARISRHPDHRLPDAARVRSPPGGLPGAASGRAKTRLRKAEGDWQGRVRNPATGRPRPPLTPEPCVARRLPWGPGDTRRRSFGPSGRWAVTGGLARLSAGPPTPSRPPAAARARRGARPGASPRRRRGTRWWRPCARAAAAPRPCGCPRAPPAP